MLSHIWEVPANLGKVAMFVKYNKECCQGRMKGWQDTPILVLDVPKLMHCIELVTIMTDQCMTGLAKVKHLPPQS
jgi:hypothetical protein